MESPVAYLPAHGFANELERELERSQVTLRGWQGRLLLAEGPPQRPAWAADVWDDPRELPADSISQGAKALRQLQRNWALLEPPAQRRRAQLIAERLPHVSMRALRFPEPAPSAPLGSWTLLDNTRILAAPSTANPFPHGIVRFREDRQGPPNRAYLKLWEALTRIPERPRPGGRALDLGAAPGGWTWVLSGLGLSVLAIDKAPLAPAVVARPGVTVRRQSAFGVDPDSVGPVDWLCCDVICYPHRLLTLVQRWLASGLARNFICSVKFQHATDFEIQDALAALPGSLLVHLHHNKHELTWINLERWRV